MKVKLLKPWIAAFEKPVGSIVNIPDELVESGVERGLCKTISVAEEKQAEKKRPGKMNTAELEARAAELEVDISGAKNNRERAVLIQEELEKRGE